MPLRTSIPWLDSLREQVLASAIYDLHIRLCCNPSGLHASYSCMQTLIRLVPAGFIFCDDLEYSAGHEAGGGWRHRGRGKCLNEICQATTPPSISLAVPWVAPELGGDITRAARHALTRAHWSHSMFPICCSKITSDALLPNLPYCI